MLTRRGSKGCILPRLYKGWRRGPATTLLEKQNLSDAGLRPRVSLPASRAGLGHGVQGSLHPPPSTPSSCADIQTLPAHRHLKSQEPAARSTLLGCQSRLRTVERMGFLMCLHTHLDRWIEGGRDGRAQHAWPLCPRDSTFPWGSTDPLPPTPLTRSQEGGAWVLPAHQPARAQIRPVMCQVASRVGPLSRVSFKPHDNPGDLRGSVA